MKKYLVTGGSGKLSSKVIEFLLDEYKVSPSEIVVTTRDVSKLSNLTEKGVEVRAVDFADTSSIAKAFSDVENVLLVSIDQIGVREELHTNAIKVADEVGVKHLVYTSMPNVDSSPIVFTHEHKASEEAIKVSTIASWTILRNNWYFENFIEFYGDIFKSEKWLSAAGDGKVAQLSRIDLAFGAASALVKAGNEKKIYDLSGAEALNTNEYAATMNSVLNKSIEIINVDNETYKSQLLSFGVPAEIVDMLASFEEHNKLGLSNISSKDFETLTGRKPQLFKEWIEGQKETILAL